MQIGDKLSPSRSTVSVLYTLRLPFIIRSSLFAVHPSKKLQNVVGYIISQDILRLREDLAENRL
jgi:hypothetical protein